jgi:hypothetical protein
VPRLVARLVVDYCAYATCLGASAPYAACRAARRRLLRLRRASGCLGTSRNSSSTIAPMPCIWVPRHLARLVTPLVINYFTYTACPGASAPRAAHRVARRPARCRLLRICRASGYLGTSHGPSCGSSSTISCTPRVWMPRHVARLVVDYFANAARPGASGHRTARRAARRRLLRVHRASGCLGTSLGSSSTTSRTPRIRVPRLVAPLVVDYCAYATCLGASAPRAARRVARRAARRRLLRLRHASRCLGTSRGSSSTTAPT